MKHWKTALLVVALLLAVTACRQEEPPAAADEDIIMSLGVIPPSLQVGEALLAIAVTTDNLDAVEVTKLTVRGDMDHAGMVPVIAESTSGDGGHFEVPFEWTMGGDWTVEITAELADGRVVTETFNVTISSEGDAMEMPMPEMTEEPGN